MHVRRKTAFAAVLLPLLAVCSVLAVRASATTDSNLGTFPAIQATSLRKVRMRLPQDFTGRLNLVVVSFAREQQKDVDTWLPLARQIQSAHNDFSYYELPTMSRENLLYRWWFDAALRSDTSEKDLRARILTAYINKHKFRQALHIPSEKRIVALLVDKTGKIYWRSNGKFTPDAKQSLLSALSSNGM